VVSNERDLDKQERRDTRDSADFPALLKLPALNCCKFFLWTSCMGTTCCLVIGSLRDEASGLQSTYRVCQRTKNCHCDTTSSFCTLLGWDLDVAHPGTIFISCFALGGQCHWLLGLSWDRTGMTPLSISHREASL
jgi:hypothetical protein